MRAHYARPARNHTRVCRQPRGSLVGRLFNGGAVVERVTTAVVPRNEDARKERPCGPHSHHAIHLKQSLLAAQSRADGTNPVERVSRSDDLIHPRARPSSCLRARPLFWFYATCEWFWRGCLNGAPRVPHFVSTPSSQVVAYQYISVMRVPRVLRVPLFRGSKL